MSADRKRSIFFYDKWLCAIDLVYLAFSKLVLLPNYLEKERKY